MWSLAPGVTASCACRYIVVAGGFGSSSAVQRCIAGVVDAYYAEATRRPLVVLAANAANAIAEGAGRYARPDKMCSTPLTACARRERRYGLTPESFVSSRIVRHNFGFLKAVPRSMPLHAYAKTRTTSSGLVYANSIVRLLAAKGSSVESIRLPPTDPRACVVREFPVDRSLSSVTIRFVRTHLYVPSPDDTTRVAVCRDGPPEGSLPVPLTPSAEPTTVFVPQSHVVAILRVDLPPMESRAAGACSLQFHFGSTEIEAVVRVLSTGEEQRCVIHYLDDRPTMAEGAVVSHGDDDEDPTPHYFSTGTGGAAATRAT